MSLSDNSGKKLFKDPHIDILRGNKLPDLFDKVKNSGDDRSRSILLNLILEHLTDILLGHLIKNYKKFTKTNRPAFFLKLSLLNSFELIPDQVFASIDCLREIRNKFAHRLEITKYSDLDDEIISKINQSVRSASFDNEEIPETIENKISRIEFHAVVGLDSYEPNLRLLSDQINSEEFKEVLDSEYKKRLKAQSTLLRNYMRREKES